MKALVKAIIDTKTNEGNLYLSEHTCYHFYLDQDARVNVIGYIQGLICGFILQKGYNSPNIPLPSVTSMQYYQDKLVLDFLMVL